MQGDDHPLVGREDHDVRGEEGLGGQLGVVADEPAQVPGREDERSDVRPPAGVGHDEQVIAELGADLLDEPLAERHVVVVEPEAGPGGRRDALDLVQEEPGRTRHDGTQGVQRLAPHPGRRRRLPR